MAIEAIFDRSKLCFVLGVVALGGLAVIEKLVVCHQYIIMIQVMKVLIVLLRPFSFPAKATVPTLTCCKGRNNSLFGS